MAASFLVVGLVGFVFVLVIVGIIVALAAKGSKGAAIGVSAVFCVVLLFFGGVFALFVMKNDASHEHLVMTAERAEMEMVETVARMETVEASSISDEFQIVVTYADIPSDKVGLLNELVMSKVESPLKALGGSMTTMRSRSSSGGKAEGRVNLTLREVDPAQVAAIQTTVDAAVGVFEKALADEGIEKGVGVAVTSPSATATAE